MPSSNPAYPTIPGPGLTPVQAAQARHHSYTLLGRLYQSGVTTALLPTIAAIPALNKHLPAPLNTDEQAAGHYQLFGYHLHPYASVFLDTSGLIGGPITDTVIRDYQQAGYQPPAGSLSPDHIAAELAFLAYLSGAEQKALAAGHTATTKKLRSRQRDFIAGHLLCWLPPVIIALEMAGDSFYAAVGELTLALVAYHYDRLNQLLAPRPESPFTLPPAPDLLPDPQTSLKEIARYLITPPHCGLYLGKSDIGRLARRLELPRGFGNRQQMLLNLLRTAGQYEQFSELLLALGGQLGEWQSAYQRQTNNFPEIAAFVSLWAARLSQSESLVTNMVEIARKSGQ